MAKKQPEKLRLTLPRNGRCRAVVVHNRHGDMCPYFPPPPLSCTCASTATQMASSEAQAEFLGNFRADSIVEDCEAVRKPLNPFGT